MNFVSSLRKKLSTLVYLLVSIIVGISSLPAQGALVTLTPDDVLEIHFTVPTLPHPDTDMFYIFANGSTITGGFTVVTELYDGNTLLGTYTDGYSQITSRWKELGGLNTNGNPEIIDFTSILDGTIDGYTRTTISANSITFDTDAVQGKFGRGIDATSWYSDFAEANILSVNIVSTVPVPAAVWLFGSGLIGLVGLARRKKA